MRDTHVVLHLCMCCRTEVVSSLPYRMRQCCIKCIQHSDCFEYHQDRSLAHACMHHNIVRRLSHYYRVASRTCQLRRHQHLPQSRARFATVISSIWHMPSRTLLFPMNRTDRVSWSAPSLDKCSRLQHLCHQSCLLSAASRTFHLCVVRRTCRVRPVVPSSWCWSQLP